MTATRTRSPWTALAELPLGRGSGWRNVAQNLPASIQVAPEGAELAAACGALAGDLLTGRYDPRPPWSLGVVKASGGIRNVALLPLADRLAYTALHDALAPLAEATLPAPSTPFGAVSVVRDVPEEGLLATGKAFFLFADVANCYGSLDQEAIVSRLGTAGAPTPLLDALDALLPVLAPGGGIPVGPNCGQAFVNAVMAPADAILARGRWPYARRYDDVALGLDDPDEADAATDALTEALATVDLRINPAKTVVVPAAALRSGIEATATLRQALRRGGWRRLPALAGAERRSGLRAELTTSAVLLRNGVAPRHAAHDALEHLRARLADVDLAASVVAEALDAPPVVPPGAMRRLHLALSTLAVAGGPEHLGHTKPLLARFPTIVPLVVHHLERVLAGPSWPTAVDELTDVLDDLPAPNQRAWVHHALLPAASRLGPDVVARVEAAAGDEAVDWVSRVTALRLLAAADDRLDPALLAGARSAAPEVLRPDLPGGT